VAETYFRFVYDTTDSLGYTRVSERWVQRHWRLNNAGCRDSVDYAPRLEAGKRRLTFVGDSFTAGHGIKNVDDRFPNLLRQAHRDWQVHVLANVGMDTGAETVLVNKLAAKGYAFDQVVLVYCLNDIGDLLAQQDEAFTHMFDSMASGNWLTRNSYALNLMTQRYQAGRNPYVRNYFSFVRKAYQGETWERQKARLRQLHAAVLAHGGRLAVVTFPLLDALGPDYPYQIAHAELNSFWREQGVPHLDLLPVYANIPPRDLVVNPHDAHPNERASRLAAEAIENFLFPRTTNPHQ
jgi:lysophospholipase L1-like esterase